jgi:hypothetical protein
MGAPTAGGVGRVGGCDSLFLPLHPCSPEFRYNERMALDVTDAEHAAKAVKGVVGKWVTYHDTWLIVLAHAGLMRLRF